jgi:hypothetical protein
MLSSFRGAVALLAALAGFALPAFATGERALLPGQKVAGSIDAGGDEDAYRFHAEAGWKVSLTVKARKGQLLKPAFTRLDAPTLGDLLSTAVVKKSRKGDSVRIVNFLVPETGTWVFGLTGAGQTIGTYDMTSRGPSRIPLGAGGIAAPGEEDDHPFEAEKGTEATLTVKAAKGSLLVPRFARVERPAAAGDLDLAPFKRSSGKRSDTLKKLLLGEAGTWTPVVTGADGTTGDYAATMKVGRKVPLDFTGIPAVTAVSPASCIVPSTGNGFVVTGRNFVDGCTVALNPSGNVTGLAVQFENETRLSVTFDVTAGAATGPRSLSVTNPDAKSGSKASAINFAAAPTGAVVASVSPDHGPAAGGTRVVVLGANFDPDAAVRFGALDATAVVRLDSGTILCTVPAAVAASTSAGTPVAVTVDNGGGDSDALASGWTYDADPQRPSVVATIPANGATGVARNLRRVVFVLDDAADPSTVVPSAFLFGRINGPQDIVDTTPVAASVGPGGKVLVIQRAAATGGDMTASADYLMEIQSEVTDLAGNGVTDIPGTGVWQASFTTGAGTDDTGPGVQFAVPAAATPGVVADVVPFVTFDEPVDPASVAGAVTLEQGGTPVPSSLLLTADCRTVAITPDHALAPSTTYSIEVATSLRDLAHNPIGSAFSSSFTTAASDSVVPAATLTVDSLGAEWNGSTGYKAGTSNGGSPSGSGADTPFDAYLPRFGFTVDLSFEDLGGSGVDPATLVVTCSHAVGTEPAGTNLAFLFSTSPLGATWTIDAAHAIPAASDVTFSAVVEDHEGNVSNEAALTVDVADIHGTPPGKSGDRDPFNSRQSWLLRFDQDIWTTTIAAGGSGNHSNPVAITSVKASNGLLDFEEDLRLVGLNGPETGTNASSVVNSGAVGTNAIVRLLLKEACRGYVNMRWGIGYDGTRTSESPDIEFLLEGESRTGGGPVSPTGWTSGSGFSMMTFTGDERPSSSIGVIGRVGGIDFRNRNQENDSNSGNGSGNNYGVFLTNMIRFGLNDWENSDFPLTFDPLVSVAGRGGTPVGTSNLDGTVLAGSFNYAGGTTQQKARYDLVMTAIDRLARYMSQVGAHEMGHSTGLVADGAPPTGLFGNAHPSNTFIASADYTASGHIDIPGPNLMEAASSFFDALGDGSDFSLFEPLCVRYLLRRFVYDQ